MRLPQLTLSRVVRQAAPPKLRGMAAGGIRKRMHSWARCSSGQMLIEALIALVIFAIAATAVVSLLSSSTTTTTRVKQQTLGEQGVLNQIEKIRSMDYNAVGTINGCVPGSISSSVVFTGLNGETLGVPAHLNTNVSYMSANVPGSAMTGADYKQVTVSITRDSDGKVLGQATTYLAPKNEPSQTTGTIQAAVNDYGAAGTPMSGVQVQLLNGPSSPETCTTNSSGSVTFPGLTPNPTSGGQAYYDLVATPPSGYQVLSDDYEPPYHTKTPAYVQLSPTQFWTTTLFVFKPSTIVVNLQDLPAPWGDGLTYTGTTSVKVTSNDPRTTGQNHTFTYSGGPLTITKGVVSADGNYLVPGQYTVQVTPPTGYVPIPADTQTIPAGYPGNTTGTFNEWMIPQGELDVTVVKTYTGLGGGTKPCSGATVTLNGGPDNLVNQTATTNSSGLAKITGLTPGGALTPSPPLSTTLFSVKAQKGGSQNTNPSVTVNPGPSATPLTMNIGSTSTTC